MTWIPQSPAAPTVPAGVFRPCYQLCTLSQPTLHTHTHLLTHPHSNFSVARIPRVHAPHCAQSCRSEGGEMVSDGATLTNQMLTRGRYYSTRSMMQSGGDNASVCCVALWDMIRNPALSESPVSLQKHWSRNIGLHPCNYHSHELHFVWWSQGIITE